MQGYNIWKRKTNHVSAHYIIPLYSSARVLALSLKFNILKILKLRFLCIIWLTHCPVTPHDPVFLQKDKNQNCAMIVLGVVWSKKATRCQKRVPELKNQSVRARTLSRWLALYQKGEEGTGRRLSCSLRPRLSPGQASTCWEEGRLCGVVVQQLCVRGWDYVSHQPVRLQI